MKWRIKALLHRALDAAPYGEALHLALQRHVTRSLPRRLADYPRYLEESRQQWRAFSAAPNAPSRLYFEFGAGWDLFHNLYLYSMGLERQLVVDLYPHLRVDLVNNVINNFRRMPPLRTRPSNGAQASTVHRPSMPRSERSSGFHRV